MGQKTTRLVVSFGFVELKLSYWPAPRPANCYFHRCYLHITMAHAHHVKRYDDAFRKKKMQFWEIKGSYTAYFEIVEVSFDFRC